MIILQYHEIFSGWQHQQPCWNTLVLSAWKKSHDIIILSFCNIAKGQANYGSNSLMREQVFHAFWDFRFSFMFLVVLTDLHLLLTYILTVLYVFAHMWNSNHQQSNFRFQIWTIFCSTLSLRVNQNTYQVWSCSIFCWM